MSDLIECSDCGRPVEYDAAEPIEDGRGFGPRLVCASCAHCRTTGSPIDEDGPTEQYSTFGAMLLGDI